MLLDLYMASSVFSTITITTAILFQSSHKEIFKDEEGEQKHKTKYSFVIEYDGSNKKHKLVQNIILLIVFLTPIINIFLAFFLGWYTLKMSIRHRNI